VSTRPDARNAYSSRRLAYQGQLTHQGLQLAQSLTTMPYAHPSRPCAAIAILRGRPKFTVAAGKARRRKPRSLAPYAHREDVESGNCLGLAARCHVGKHHILDSLGPVQQNARVVDVDGMVLP
jgi:hypothetical protein